MPIRLIHIKNKKNIINIYKSHLSRLINEDFKTYSLVSKIPKNYAHQTCLDILAADSIVSHEKISSEENFLGLLNNLDQSTIQYLINHLPSLKSHHKDLNYDEKIIFNFIRSILKENSVILIEDLDQFISAQVLRDIKKNIMYLNNKYHFFILTNHLEYWSDIAEEYILIDKETKVLKNKFKQDQEVFDTSNTVHKLVL